MKKKKNKNKPTVKWLPTVVITFFVSLALLSAVSLSFWFIFQQKFANRIFPGVKIAGLDMSGLNFDQAQKKLNQKINQISETGFIFVYEKKQASLPLSITSPDADLTYDIISLDPEATIGQALRFGRSDNFSLNLKNIYSAWRFNINLALQYHLDQKKAKQILGENFSQFELEPQNAKLVWQKDDFKIKKERPGLVLDYKRALTALKSHIEMLDSSPIELFMLPVQPQISQDQCNIENLRQAIKEIFKHLPLTLTYKNQKWQLNKKQIQQWLILKKGHSCLSQQISKFCANNEKIVVGLDKEKIIKYLEKNIAPDINREPINAKFKIEDGRVVEFQTSQNGLKLASDKTAQKIENILLNSTSTLINLITEEVVAQVTTENINNLGIREIIGTGHSNFAGSPRNRRHNIAQGANTLNGLLIKPDEKFSLVKALGEINAETGYLPELVIKGNRTIPEFGGGLCQIGTTMFRAALASGLPILERRNHSYRVSYYEPAGTDATIYNPKPDLRFKNDTGHYILIQTRIEGNDLYFDFWGTKDGRKVEITEPTIYNIVRPGPTKLIETTELEPGEKKCTEHAHNGADAYFDYTVTYPDGTTKHKRFTSHYRPWQEVCLIGVKKTASSSPTTNE